MRIEFNQGVPPGCIEWLWNNVGPGNIEPRGDCGDDWGDAWLYERISIPVPMNELGEYKCVPTITVNDPVMAMMFMLRWK